VVSRSAAQAAAHLEATTAAQLICDVVCAAYDPTPVTLYACQTDSSDVSGL
jgi:hypothetical protein